MLGKRKSKDLPDITLTAILCFCHWCVVLFLTSLRLERRLGGGFSTLRGFPVILARVVYRSWVRISTLPVQEPVVKFKLGSIANLSPITKSCILLRWNRLDCGCCWHSITTVSGAEVLLRTHG